MKHKTAELTGRDLDNAAAKALGADVAGYDWSPSTAWKDGGPIIERERITMQASQSGDWRAFLGDGTTNAGTGRSASVPMIHARGDTPLIAAMRAFVASKLGDEVDL